MNTVFLFFENLTRDFLPLFSEGLDWVSGFFLMSGVAFILIGVVGLLRFPDIYARLHATSLTDTLGTSLIIVGLCLHAGWSLALIKLIMIALFVLISTPTATHALANASFLSEKTDHHIKTISFDEDDSQ